MIYKEIFHNEFCEVMSKCGFTYEGASALYEWFNELSQDVEFDPIAFNCEFVEYADIKEFHGNYNKKDYPNIEAIQGATTLIEIPEGGFIIQAF